jgi:hypothetical protein
MSPPLRGTPRIAPGPLQFCPLASAHPIRAPAQQGATPERSRPQEGGAVRLSAAVLVHRTASRKRTGFAAPGGDRLAKPSSCGTRKEMGAKGRGGFLPHTVYTMVDKGLFPVKKNYL